MNNASPGNSSCSSWGMRIGMITSFCQTIFSQSSETHACIALNQTGDGRSCGLRGSIRRQLKRRYVLAFFQKLTPCLVGIEACASSHHWSRELQALGHTVRLMPPAYVKPYVKRQKNDATDAEAICEAVTRANMRFVPTKTPEQQSGLV